MKKIILEINEEDFKVLMELSKELQLQDNNGQAFPYFWEPSSEKLVPNFHDEGNKIQIHDNDQCETYNSIEKFLEYGNEEEFWEKFCKEEDLGEIEYNEKEHESDFLEFLKGHKNDRFHVFSSDWKRERDHNPSLFFSDVKGYCESNSHHLGRKPMPYSDSIWRMPKMQKLVELLMRLNPQSKEEINHEALRFVHLKKN